MVDTAKGVVSRDDMFDRSGNGDSGFEGAAAAIADASVSTGTTSTGFEVSPETTAAVEGAGLDGDGGIEGAAAALAKATVLASLDIGLSIVNEMAVKKAAGQLANA